MNFPPEVVREVESYSMREHRELIYNYGTEAADTKGLLWSVLYPIPKDKLDNLFLNYNIKQISLLSIPKLMNLGFSQTQATKIQSVFELARRLETFIEEPKRKICSQRMFTLSCFQKCGNRKKRNL